MPVNINTLTPGSAIHPGEILQDELDARAIKQKDFADLTGIHPTQLNEIINGKRGINADAALIIGKALSMDPKIWLNLQNNYELDLAKINEKNKKRIQAIGLWQTIQPFIAEKFLKKQGYLTGDIAADVNTIKHIYDIHHLEQFADSISQSTSLRLRKSQKIEVDKVNLIGWIKAVTYEASKLKVANFDFRNYDELVSQLKNVVWKNKNTVVKTGETLKSYGIKLIIMDNPEKCPVDGFAFWNEGNPSIGMTMRHKRIDNFAFTLFHELGHVLIHLPNNNMSEFIDFDADEPQINEIKEEKEADAFAKDNLINPQSWATYIKSPTRLQDKSILNFARKEKIHPAIIKGRLCHELNNYRLKSRIDHTIN